MSPSIVDYLKMLVTLGALRHQLAIDYDLADNVRRFVRRLARQQGLSWLDPRLASTGCTRGGRCSGRSTSSSSWRARSRPSSRPRTLCSGSAGGCSNAKRTLIRLGVAILAVGAVLYLVLAFPDDARRVCRARCPNVGPLGLFVLLIR